MLAMKSCGSHGISEHTRDNPKAFPEDTLQRLLDRKQKLQLR